MNNYRKTIKTVSILVIPIAYRSLKTLQAPILPYKYGSSTKG